MIKKILIANRRENGRRADVSAKPNCMAREARAVDFGPMEKTDV